MLRKSFVMGCPLEQSARVLRPARVGAMAGPTFVRSGAAAVRSEDEDDGIMVLRFGPSAGVDLTEPLSCEARAGDDW